MAINTGNIFKQLIILPEDPKGCWDWNGSINKKTGYGKKQLDGKTLLAHRWVYTLFKGRIPYGKVIDHLCGNRKCVNPSHLEVVTQSINCQRAKTTKLTLQKVMEIRVLIEKNELSQVEIAKQYGVSNITISDIKRGKSWSDSHLCFDPYKFNWRVL